LAASKKPEILRRDSHQTTRTLTFYESTTKPNL
jgi:hypothetical protein